MSGILESTDPKKLCCSSLELPCRNNGYQTPMMIEEQYKVCIYMSCWQVLVSTVAIRWGRLRSWGRVLCPTFFLVLASYRFIAYLFRYMIQWLTAILNLYSILFKCWPFLLNYSSTNMFRACIIVYFQENTCYLQFYSRWNIILSVSFTVLNLWSVF